MNDIEFYTDKTFPHSYYSYHQKRLLRNAKKVLIGGIT